MNCFFCERFLKCLDEGRLLDVTMSNEHPAYIIGIEQRCQKENEEED